MTRKPAFWIALTILGLAGAVLAFRLFPVALPILSVDIEMDREEALTEARALADANRWEPGDYRQAASFGNLNQSFQTYMELEGGGLEELNRLVRDGILTLYAWRVRHFSPGSVEEAEIRFTPLGHPYGFRLTLSEDTPGDHLSEQEARERAIREATEAWGMEPELYELLESSQEEKPGGRLDHTFVFQRSDVAMGEARVRLRLGLAGSQLVEVIPFLHVPEAFERRYQDTRNANESISLAGTIAFLLLFLVLGGGIGGVHLLKERLLSWKIPLVWGGLVAGLMALGSVNSLPLAWMTYDTAQPPHVFVGTLVVTACLVFLGGAVFLALTFMVGEGLMRLGFPDQIQLWRSWAPGVANSAPVLGRTAAPYLLVGIELAFVVVFYLLTSRLAGWWSPAGALAEPDLLATHFPWLTAVSTSLFAAFSEEAVFRAIPIGAAALMGRRYGRPGLWIWGTVVLQALVFGASHANYPQQPAYARVVEIFPVYLAWGIVCAYFGLIPSIIGHFIYDLALFSLPLFAADTPGIWFDRGLLIAFGAVPLAVVFVARLRAGAKATAPDWALNRNWKPPPRRFEEGAPDGEPISPREGTVGRPERPGAGAVASSTPTGGPTEQVEALAGHRTLSFPSAMGLGIATVAALAIWVTGLEPGTTPRLSITRPEAEALARSALAENGLELDSDWVPLLSVTSNRGPSHLFVLRNGSEEEYRTLLGGFLSAPDWRVRFVNFEVPPEQRAESFTVTSPGASGAPSVRHELPEGRPGETLTEEEARTLALSALESRLAIRPDAVREISAQESALPERTDWTFTYSALRGYPLAEGEGRLEVRIAGDELTGVDRYVHIPEDWEREWRADLSRKNLTLMPLGGILLLAGLGALIYGVVLWARGTLRVRPLRTLTIVMGSILLITAANGWPNTLNSFNTQLSYGNQVGIILVGVILGSGVASMAVGIFGALGHTLTRGGRSAVKGSAVVGLALGITYVGASGLLSRFGPEGLPSWPNYVGAVSFLPWLSAALDPLIGILGSTSLALLVLGALERSWGTRWFWAGIALVCLIGLILAPDPFGASRLQWMAGAGVIGISIVGFWVLCRAWGWALAPGVMAAPAFLRLVETTLQRPFPGHTPGAALGMLAAVVVVIIWARALEARGGEPAPLAA
jgi:membrane protease YdiL (CAAX protease family)